MTEQHAAADTKEHTADLNAGEHIADYAPPSVTDGNVMEVIENGIRRIESGEGGALIDLSGTSDSDSTIICALVEWIAAARRQNKPLTFRTPPPRLNALLDLYQMREVIAPFCK